MTKEFGTTGGALRGVMISGAVALAFSLSACGSGGENQAAEAVTDEQVTNEQVTDEQATAEQKVEDVTDEAMEAPSETDTAEVRDELGRVIDAPDGVAFEDISTEGRDLIFTLPDGELERIENGLDYFDSVAIGDSIFPIVPTDLITCGPAPDEEVSSCASPPSRIYELPEGVRLEDVALEGDDILVTLPTGKVLRFKNARETYDFIMMDGMLFPIPYDGIAE